jgi:formylglycine-generating enzyme required for sulfatase activity
MAGRPIPTGPIIYRGGAMDFEGTINTDAELRTYSGGTSADPACNWTATDREFHPMNCVNWATAQAFCVWDGSRLATQAEWELAARGSETPPRIYPWGNAAPDDVLTCWSGSGMTRSTTCPVGTFLLGVATGIHDLAGNVSEWNADRFEPYTMGGSSCWGGGASGTTNPVCRVAGSTTRVLRSGSWSDNTEPYMHPSSRIARMPEYRINYVGFRCARDVP